MAAVTLALHSTLEAHLPFKDLFNWCEFADNKIVASSCKDVSLILLFKAELDRQREVSSPLKCFFAAMKRLKIYDCDFAQMICVRLTCILVRWCKYIYVLFRLLLASQQRYETKRLLNCIGALLDVKQRFGSIKKRKYY